MNIIWKLLNVWCVSLIHCCTSFWSLGAFVNWFPLCLSKYWHWKSWMIECPSSCSSTRWFIILYVIISSCNRFLEVRGLNSYKYFYCIVANFKNISCWAWCDCWLFIYLFPFSFPSGSYHVLIDIIGIRETWNFKFLKNSQWKLNYLFH